MSDTAYPNLGQRLAALFDQVRPPADKRFRTGRYPRDLVAGEVGTTKQYIGQLIKGERVNPDWDIMSGIAKFFELPSTYFVVEDQSEADRILDERLHPENATYPNLADRLRALFDSVHHPAEAGAGEPTPYSIVDIARAARTTKDEVNQILKGQRRQPTLAVLSGIAAAFGVSPGYFTVDASEAARLLGARVSPVGTPDQHEDGWRFQLSQQLRDAVQEGDVRAVAARDFSNQLNDNLGQLSEADLQTLLGVVQAIARRAGGDAST